MAKSEERFPLLYALNLDDGDNPPSQSRERNLLNGASSVIGAWPAAISSTWRMIIGILLFILTVILIVCIMFFLTSVCIPGAFPVPHNLGKRAAAAFNSCDFVDQSQFEEGGGLWNNLIPLETQMRFIKDDHKVFFVKRESDALSPESVCAIRSAFLNNNRSTYLIVLVNTDNITLKDEMRILEELRKDKLDQEMNVMFIDADKYFYDTPLRGVYKRAGKSPLKLFAVRVVTLWRFGGLAYDLDLLTVRSVPPADPPQPPREQNVTTTAASSSSPASEDATTTVTTTTTTVSNDTRVVATAPAGDVNATIAADGTIIGSRQPCHAFLFAVMKTLLKVAQRSSPTTVAEVMKLALQSFCVGQEEGKDCPGVKVLPKEMICATDEIVNSTNLADLKCNWAKIEASEATKVWAEKCPIFN